MWSAPRAPMSSSATRSSATWAKESSDRPRPPSPGRWLSARARNDIPPSGFGSPNRAMRIASSVRSSGERPSKVKSKLFDRFSAARTAVTVTVRARDEAVSLATFVTRTRAVPPCQLMRVSQFRPKATLGRRASRAAATVGTGVSLMLSPEGYRAAGSRARRKVKDARSRGQSRRLSGMDPNAHSGATGSPGKPIAQQETHRRPWLGRAAGSANRLGGARP